MINLDSYEEIVEFDKGHVCDSIRSFPLQFKQAWYEIKALKVNDKFKNIENVVISGMGGSALGGRIIDSLISDKINLPVEVFTEFHLPNYVSSNTLVIISSYSGNTEETIADLFEAKQRKAKIFIITTGGKLEEIAKKEKILIYKIDPIHNPSKQPRMALGYSVSAIASFLSKLSLLNLTNEQIDILIESIKKLSDYFGPENPSDKNPAKNMAKNIKQTLPVLIASEHLVGSAHSFKNQLNETAKTFSALFDIPELNHHLMEGLKNPGKIKEILKFIFLESDLYSGQIIKRYPITKDVVEKNGVSYINYKTISKDKLTQSIEVIILGMFVSFYLALLYEEDPSKIPWVEYFKEHLTK